MPNFAPDQMSSSPARLIRNPENGRLTGLCAAIADRLGIDPILVRTFFILAALCGGAGIIFYVMLWVSSPTTKSPAPLDKLWTGWHGLDQLSIVLLCGITAFSFGAKISFPLGMAPLIVIGITAAIAALINRRNAKPGAHPGNNSHLPYDFQDGQNAQTTVGYPLQHQPASEKKPKYSWLVTLIAILVSLGIGCAIFVTVEPALGITTALIGIAISLIVLSGRKNNGALIATGILLSLLSLGAGLGVKIAENIATIPATPAAETMALNDRLLKIDATTMPADEENTLNINVVNSIIFLDISQDADVEIVYQMTDSVVGFTQQSKMDYRLGDETGAMGSLYAASAYSDQKLVVKITAADSIVVVNSR